MASNDTLRNIDKLLSKQEHDALAKRFTKKYGYPMGKNPLQVESLMKRNDKPGDKQSFIDAYLYGMARTLHKNVYGLENASAQVDEYYGSKGYLKERLLDLLDDGTEKSRDNSEEEMVKIYRTGDLDMIYQYANDKGLLDSAIMKRNIVMAESMIRLMHNHTLFTAVGAAHLPGPNGVIALLKKAGYTVTRVQAAFTGVANKYVVDYMKMDWNIYRYDNVGCSISFPGTPINVPVSGINNPVYIDLANETYYGLTISPQGTDDKPASWHNVLQKALGNLTEIQKGSIISRKDITYDKMPCTEVIVKNNTGYTRTRFLLVNNLLYTAIVGSSANNLNQPFINRYFNSFALIPLIKAAPANWVTFKDDVGAFSVNMPSSPQKIEKEVAIKADRIVHINMYVSVDSVNYTTYLVRYNNFPIGMYLKDKETAFNNLISEFKGKAELTQPVKIWQDGFEGREAKAVLPHGYNAIMRFIARGNRIYLLLKTITKTEMEKGSGNDAFFNSFKLLPYKETEYYDYTNDSANFKIKMVAKPSVKPDSVDSNTSFLKKNVAAFATDPNSGALYDFEYSKISPYYRANNTDTLSKYLLNNLKHYDDTILRADSILIGGLKAREMLILNKTTQSESRVRLIINGGYVYFMLCYADSASLYSKAGNTFFNSFEALHQANAIDLSSSKADKIYNDLASSDTMVYKSALGALSYYDFKKNELPCIYKAIQRDYPDDTSEAGARQKLLKKLRHVNSDSTVAVLSALYVTLKNKDDLKGTILSEIPDIDKKNGYDIYFKLLTTQPPLNVTESYGTFAPLVDSIKYAAAHFQEILPFVKYDNLRSGVMRVAKNIAFDKMPEYNKMLAANYEQIMAFAPNDAAKYIKNKDNSNSNFSSSMYSYMQLAGKIKNAAVNDWFTAFYIKNDHDGIYLPDAIAARVYNNLPNNPVLVNKFLDSMGTRYNLMEAYNDAKLLSRVPLKYRSQSEFAKLCLYQEIIDDDDDNGAPEKLSLLGSIVDKGSVYYVFDFMQTEREEGKKFIGITGPYKPGSAKLDFSRYYAYSEYAEVKANWKKQAQALIKPLLDSYKK